MRQVLWTLFLRSAGLQSRVIGLRTPRRGTEVPRYEGLKYAVSLFLAIALTGCARPPKLPAYATPTAPSAPAWDTPAPWRPSDPKDAIPKGEWWTVFHDDELSDLVKHAVTANQTIDLARAQYMQARALTGLALSALYPQVAIGGLVQDQRLAGTRAGGGGTAANQATFSVTPTVSYEVDLFGKRVQSIESAQATLQSSAAQLENATLIVTAEVASDYFTLRRIDTEIGILARSVESFTRALELVRNRHDGGIASGLDVAQEEALVASTRTEATLLRQQRDAFEHAIAVLVGQPAPLFHLASRDLTVEPPAIDTGLPTDLLERRPDIAGAERQVDAANARIGVARSAYFPSIGLFGSGGLLSGNLWKILDVPSLVWGVGAAVTQELFTGGARKAQMDFAQAGFDAAVAGYRQSVLQALAEVEDDLSGLVVLNDARATQTDAVAAATRALDIANDRYIGGLVTSLDVVTAQQTLLANQRLAAQIQGERLVTTVQLIKALGGGWDASSLAAARVKR